MLAEGFQKTSREPHALHFLSFSQIVRYPSSYMFSQGHIVADDPGTVGLYVMSHHAKTMEDANGNSLRRLRRGSAR
jgi:hypothetical protein